MGMGILWGYPQDFLWVWDGYGDRNSVPTAALQNLCCSDDHPMARDFTYIDDVTSCVVAAMNYKPTRCGQVFNIARGSPVVVRRMIAMLEAELNVTARIVI